MCCNEDDGEVDAVATAALLSRPATNALAALATEAVLSTTATQPPTTLSYTIYIYKYASSAYTTRKAHLPMNAQVKECCLGDPGLSWIQPHTIKSRPQPHSTYDMMLPKQRQQRNYAAAAVHALAADVHASTSSSSRPAQGSLQWAMPAPLIMSPASRFYLRLMLRRRHHHRRRRLSESLRFESCSHLLFPGKHTASEHKLKPLLLELNNERSHVREVNQLLAFRRRQRWRPCSSAVT